MPVGAALTTTVDPTRMGAILTFVTPAPAGCDMKCPHCFIDRRRETTDRWALAPTDYVEFIRQFSLRGRIAAITIQGREPMAAEALPWTEAILAEGRDLGVETGFVTNGLALADRIDLLQSHKVSGIAVSVDADNPVEHDRLRRRPGAWNAAMDAASLATRELPNAQVVVNSVMFPGRAGRLTCLPERLAELGIRKWSVSPLITFTRDGQWSVAQRQDEWLESIELLAELAGRSGVALVADDEFGVHFSKDGEPRSIPNALFRTLQRPDGVFRLSPDGRCSRGLDILNSLSANAIVWSRESGIESLMASRPN